MKKLYLMAILLLGAMVSAQAYRRGYQRTINRAQVDRSRRMMGGYPSSRRPGVRPVTGRPMGRRSWMQETQDMEAQNLASDMSMGM